MGRVIRPQPKEPVPKLVAIRSNFGWTMNEMAANLRGAAAEETIHSGYIADYECGRREPSLFALLAYSKVARISLNAIVDDQGSLPTKFVRRNPVRRSPSDRKKPTRHNPVLAHLQIEESRVWEQPSIYIDERLSSISKTA